MMESAVNMTFSLADMGVVVTVQKGAHYSALLLLLLTSIATFRALTKPKTNAPLFDPPGFFEFSATRRKKQALHGGQSLLERSEKAYPGTCFRIMTNFGEVTMLPLKHVNEVRNDERLDLGDTYTQPLNRETAFALSETLTEDQDWHLISLKHVVLQLTTRISSRVFPGKELCRNEAWLKVSQWLEASSITGKDGPVLAQLALSVLAIHTTADLLSQAVGDLAVHHEFVEPLRDEITECLAQDGWER
ncbi:hypothetical protein E4U59_002047 [Claviceps monticola]|nr:hypothetical protein E4U59_002047 [Claviceps monticola]